MKEKKTYNHAFDIAFSVSDSEYEDWFDCLKHEKGAVINALQRRVREVFESGEHLEAISGFDSYEEGNALPPITNPDLIDNSDKATKKVAIDNN